MISKEAFLKKLIALYWLDATDAHCTTSSMMTCHTINHPLIHIDIGHNKMFGGYLLTIQDNKLFPDIPKFHTENEDIAQAAFEKLEQIAQQANIYQPLNAAAKKIVFSIITNKSDTINFRSITSDNGLESLNLCKINTDRIQIEAYESFQSCMTNQPFYYTLIRTDNSWPALPTRHNTINSNDKLFAKQLFKTMKSYVK